jgi:hypothetical protein
MKKDAQKRHQEVLEMIEELSEATASDRASTVSSSKLLHQYTPDALQISGHYSWFSNR